MTRKAMNMSDHLDEGWDTESTAVAPKSSVKEVSVSITQSIKLHGDLISVTLGEVRTLVNGTEADAIVERDSITQLLTEQGTTYLEAARKKHGDVVPAPVTPGYVQRPAAPVAAAPQAAAAPVTGNNFAAVAAVANGAPVAQGEWRSVPSRFGEGEIRFLPTSVYPTAKLEAEVAAFLTGKGLNPGYFKVWDNRPGQKGLEAGVPNGAVAAIKLTDGAPGKEQIGNNAAARVKFNNDGSLYIWLTKEFEAALKFVGPALGQAANGGF